jgi:hypothetical protein
MRPALVLLLSSLIGCGASASSSRPSYPSNAQAGADAPTVPPAVLAGNATLDCTISNREKGRQKLVLSGGQGLEFDVVVNPIVDGVVETRGEAQGGSYRFTSHLAAPGTATLSGVGAVSIDELETKVNVEMQRYHQPGGPGTELTFRSDEVSARGIYVEFAGRATATNGDRYAFRVTLGVPGPGSGGKVLPQSDAARAPIMGKAVMIVAPTTTVVTGPARVVLVPTPTETKTEVRKLP